MVNNVEESKIPTLTYNMVNNVEESKMSTLTYNMVNNVEESKIPTLTYNKDLHNRINSLRSEVCVYKFSLRPSFVMQVSVPSQESERWCMCVRGIGFANSTIFCRPWVIHIIIKLAFFNFGIVDQWLFYLKKKK
jgi:hypothetical protein